MKKEFLACVIMAFTLVVIGCENKEAPVLLKLVQRDLNGQQEYYDRIDYCFSKDCALVIMDAWEGRPVENLIPAIEIARMQGIIIIFLLNGGELSPSLIVESTDYQVEEESAFREVLKENNIQVLIYAGYNTNQCVIAREAGIVAMSREYYCILLRDATQASGGNVLGHSEKEIRDFTTYLVELNWGTSMLVNGIEAIKYQIN